MKAKQSCSIASVGASISRSISSSVKAIAALSTQDYNPFIYYIF